MVGDCAGQLRRVRYEVATEVSCHLACDIEGMRDVFVLGPGGQSKCSTHGQVKLLHLAWVN